MSAITSTKASTVIAIELVDLAPRRNETLAISFGIVDGVSRFD
jgi:hypothetical protein